MNTLDLESLKLGRGSHEPPNGKKDGCLLEWASYLAGEPWSDHPECVSPVIAAFGRRWNDDLSDTDRQILVPYLPKLLNTRGTKAQENQRAWMVTDWMVRTYLPAWLELAKLNEQAEAVRALSPLTSAARWKKADKTVQTAGKDAAAARAAVRAAAWDAVGDAVRAAAWDAARAAAWDAVRDAVRAAAGNAAWAAVRDAVRDAVWDAAWDAAWAAARAAARNAAGDAAGDAVRAAAWDAVWAAARDAAGNALKPMTLSLQQSALQLLDDLIAVTNG